MRSHLKLLAVLYLASSALYLLGALGVATTLTGVGLFAGDLGVFALLSGLGMVVAFFLAALGLPGLLLGYGLLKHRGWSRPLGFVLALLNLLNFPIGSLIGGYTLWVLWQPETLALLGDGHAIR